MAVKTAYLTVHSPIAQPLLSRFSAKKGVFIIREKNKVLYIGSSTNIYKTIMRLFHKKGVLSSFCYHRLNFEIISTKIRNQTVSDVLKRFFAPPHNRRKPLSVNSPRFYAKKQAEMIQNDYLYQTRTAVQANHKTDKRGT